VRGARVGCGWRGARVAERALHERNDREADDLVDDQPKRRTLAAAQQARALGELGEQIVVDLRRARGGVAEQAARAEVGAALLGEAVHELARAAAARNLALERADVGGDALVPRLNGR